MLCDIDKLFLERSSKKIVGYSVQMTDGKMKLVQSSKELFPLEKYIQNSNYNNLSAMT